MSMQVITCFVVEHVSCFTIVAKQIAQYMHLIILSVNQFLNYCYYVCVG